eukprot:1335445-Amorphochlora_amoeboformis.AAC.1
MPTTTHIRSSANNPQQPTSHLVPSTTHISSQLFPSNPNQCSPSETLHLPYNPNSTPPSTFEQISRLRAEVQKATAKPNTSEHPGDLPVIPGDMLETVGEINGGEAGGSAAGEGFGTEGDAKAWRTRIGK